ncbi:protein-glutamine gamma-glutamyltransferase 2-like [Nerophis lumbriciformis]|uniref:protein-glutamine gamma-glutamyltransferase 2-like n=1 Tax=Nerophis lumbriciformis TaxID=546530 RepID=UPI002ADFA203|nr:protein-glutamine gamma-glutamyltransferase 2-like [Nerophis lumbriciformis]
MDVDPKCRENNSAHHTKDIDRERLIVRRGQPFSISVHCSESLHRDHHLALVLHLGKRGEKVIRVEKERSSKEGWRFTQEGDHNGVLLTLHSPADSIVGHYRLDMLLMTPDGRVSEKNEKIDFHLLFNPWCKDDTVHLSEEKLLQEYIMNEHGMIYTGSWHSIRSIPWHYGQFEDHVMDICFEILDNSNDALKNPEKDTEHRWDPVYVSRIISAMVNSNGDRGVLAGRWHEPYSDGVPPNRWNGSVPILQKWSRGRARPVKYGQCWVYAAVACTVLRCLGIPTRTITNFCSAHDTDGNLSVDSLVNEKLESLDTSGKSDSSWNFHCWVESWMNRVDLPKGNDGWQVLDPTPQELSDGEYCCGPCPVTAIKEGNLGVKFDAPFIFAEVNADIIKWMVRKDGQRQKLNVDQNSVGRNISTKSPFSDRREDITLQYKYPEGSKKEREICEKAGRRITEPTTEREKPGKLQMTIKPTNPLFGTDFDVVIELKNNGGVEAHAQLTMLAMAETYNCIHRGEIERQTKKVSVPAYKVHKEVLRVRYNDYAKCVSEHHLIKVMALLEAQGENEPNMVVVKIPLILPELLVEIHGQAAVNIPLKASISFTNPLPVPLKRGLFTVEGAGLVSPSEVRMNGEIGPGQKVSVKLTFTPTRTGARKLLVDFDSDRLKDVRGVATVFVEKGLLLY